jgi:3-phenylpropionate/cinnamic acid dioxygenase small subunit
MSEDLQARVKRLEATEQVRDLLSDYAFHLDMNETEALVALFTDDCSVIYGPGFGAEGIEAYRKTLDGVGSYFAATSHHVSNIKMTFENDDTAQVRSVLYAWHRYRRERPDGVLWGQYHDVVVRHGGKWRFRKRELRTTGVKDFHIKPEHQLPIGRRG